jgi:uncharacterized protein (TIGR01244 family)
MKVSKLTDTIAVTGQISPAQVAEIAEAGFSVLVNNRPDGEEAGQPDSAQIEAAAVSAGLTYHHLPVTATDFPGPDAAHMAALFDDESRPVFAFCRTGTRCTNLWVVTRPVEQRQEAVQRAQALGFDLGMAARALV